MHKFSEENIKLSPIKYVREKDEDEAFTIKICHKATLSPTDCQRSLILL